jgi:hypothetical protein
LIAFLGEPWHISEHDDGAVGFNYLSISFYFSAGRIRGLYATSPHEFKIRWVNLDTSRDSLIELLGEPDKEGYSGNVLEFTEEYHVMSYEYADFIFEFAFEKCPIFFYWKYNTVKDIVIKRI